MKSFLVTLIIIFSVVNARAVATSTKKRAPNSENFAASYGAIQVNKSSSVSVVIINGDAAKAIYDAMTDVKAVDNKKTGKFVSCEVQQNIGGGTSAGYRCDTYLQTDGGFVD